MNYDNEKEENVVRIGSDKPIYEYAWPILARVQPDPYDNFEYLKLRFAKNQIKKTFELCVMFANLGLEVKDIIKVDNGVGVKERIKEGVRWESKIIEMWEVVLVKVGAIMPVGTEFADRVKNKFEERFGRTK